MNEKLIENMIRDINNTSLKGTRLMEVCGSHTHAIGKFGIRGLLGSNIELLSGPGCPVCVTDVSIIDTAIEILDRDNVILTTFGDILRVKGSHESLLDQRRGGKAIKILYTPFEALEIAENNREKSIVFLAVGFETTAPVIASAIKLAREKNIANLYFLCSLKLMPPVMHLVLDKAYNNIHGIICPGHVASVMGADYFKFISHEYGIPAVITGFEALDIIRAIHELTLYRKDISLRKFKNLYERSVSSQGNKLAQEVIREVFDVGDTEWRGIGYIPGSSLILKEGYSQLDAVKKYNIKVTSKISDSQCLCKEILIGRKKPVNCNAFGRECTPVHPLGPCMISSEGSCAAYYKYHI
ncbi:hydrogenase formation protein HypD [Alloiococcus sp. CFN-8]|uniref:hydrogenase formation protein HypD n=1 Tax=Alloiococcus sp. CFN-8 TaxID=3416081 RepID=UPI003CF9827A